MGTETERLVALSRVGGYEREGHHVDGYERKSGMLGRLRSAADDNPWSSHASRAHFGSPHKGGTGNPWDELDLDPDHDGDVDVPGEPDRDHAEEAETHLTRALKSLRAHRDSAIRQNMYQAMVPEDDGL